MQGAEWEFLLFRGRFCATGGFGVVVGVVGPAWGGRHRARAFVLSSFHHGGRVRTTERHGGTVFYAVGNGLNAPLLMAPGGLTASPALTRAAFPEPIRNLV